MNERKLISKTLSEQMPDFEKVRRNCISQGNPKNIRSRKISINRLAFVAVCLAIVLGGTAIFVNLANVKDNPTVRKELASCTKSDRTINIVINDITEVISNDMDLKKIDAHIKDGKIAGWNFNFLSRIKIPEELNETAYYEIYTRPNTDTDDYSILHDYGVAYTCTSSENTAKQVILHFSKEFKPVRDYLFGGEPKLSNIGNTTLEIYRYENSYMTIFTYDGLNFDIEAQGITEDEFVEILVSIIAE